MKKFVARNVAEVGRDSSAAILRTTNFGLDTQCNSAIVHNIAPCIWTFTVILQRLEAFTSKNCSFQL